MRGARELSRLVQPALARGFATKSEIGVITGMPPLDIGRKVTIYSPARTAGQQGLADTAAGVLLRGYPCC